MSIEAEIAVRELDHRVNDGIDVKLLWSAQTDRVWIDVRDDRSGESFRLQVDPDDALAAFHHPYAYAPGEDDADHSVAA